MKCQVCVGTKERVGVGAFAFVIVGSLVSLQVVQAAPTKPRDPSCNTYDGRCCVPPPPAECVFAGNDQGPGTFCLGDQICCVNGGSVTADGLCCDDMGGIAAGPNALPGICTPPGPIVGACCLNGYSNCHDSLVEANCDLLGGIWTEGVTCDSLDPPCGAEACCLADPDPSQWYCVDELADDCAAIGGASIGTGDRCGDLPNSDSDSIPDECDNCPNTTNWFQDDCDGDGEGDACEASWDDRDDEYDGVCNGIDNCPNTWNDGQEDVDSDGVGDVCDNCPSVGNPLQEDCNGDGEGDACEGLWDERDLDGDGACNGDDNCVNIPNGGQGDADTDGLGDACDNCPNDTNPSQDDCNGDDEGDACDDDIDGDLILNEDDACDYTPTGGNFVDNPSSPFHGTILGDLDGDCDVDDADANILNDNRTGAGVCFGNDDNDHTDYGCGHCPPCDPGLPGISK